jgi:hypothetical protein
MPGQARFLTHLLVERWLPRHVLVYTLPMSRSPVGDALAQPRYPGGFPRGEIDERERAESHRHELLNHSGVEQTPVPTTESEQYPVTPQLVYQHDQTLHSIAGEHLEALKRDVMPEGFVLHGL